MTQVNSVTLFNTTKQPTPRVPYRALGTTLLTHKTSLHIIFIGDVYSRTLNRVYRKKDTPTNILTFSFDELAVGKNAQKSTLGEIFINLPLAKKEAHTQGVSLKWYVGFLIIHGILHIRGYKHGEKMEKLESHYAARLL